MSDNQFQNPPCKGKTELFFSYHEGTANTRRAQVKEAKAICADCPYQPECLEIGVQNEAYGIWGGATPRELKAIRRRRGIRLATRTIFPEDHTSCGSERGYQFSQTVGFDCEKCNEAHEAYLQGHIMPPGYGDEGAHPRCGTEGGYQMLARRCQANGGRAAGYVVTCPACRRAHADRSAKLRRPRLKEGEAQ